MSEPIIPAAPAIQPISNPGGAPPPAVSSAPEGTQAAPARRAPVEGITGPGFTERLRRAEETARKKLMAELGIDDPEKAKLAIGEAAKLRAESEERKRSEMTEIERYKADVERYKAEAETARAEAKAASAAVDYEKRDNLIRQTAGRYVADKFIRTARVEFKAYVESLSPSQQSRLTDQSMEIWMRKFARENSDFARPAGDTTKPNPITVVKKPLTNGASVRRVAKPGEVPLPAPGAGNPAAPNGKHVRDMSPSEVTAYARQQGLKGFKASATGARPKSN